MIYGRWEFWDKLEDVFGPPPNGDITTTVLLSHTAEQVVCNERGTNVCEFEQSKEIKFEPKMNSEHVNNYDGSYKDDCA